MSAARPCGARPRPLPLLLLLVACGPTGPWTRERALRPIHDRLDADQDGRVSAAEYDEVAFYAPSFPEADGDGDGALSVEEIDALALSQDPSTFFDPRTMLGPPGLPPPPGGRERGPGGPQGSKKDDAIIGIPSDWAPATETRLPDDPERAARGPGEEVAEPGPKGEAAAQDPGPRGKAGGRRGGGGAGGPQDGGPKHLGGPSMGGPSDRFRPPPSLLVLEILLAELRAKDPSLPLPDKARVELIGRSGRLDSIAARELLAELKLSYTKVGLEFPAALQSPPDGATPTAPLGGSTAPANSAP